MNEHLQRFKLDQTHGRCKGCRLGEGQWETYIHLLCYLAGDRVGREICNLAIMFMAWMGKGCRHYIFKCCKILTGLMKMGGPKIHPLWRHLTYWELGYGYTPYLDDSEMEGPIREWLVNPIKLGGHPTRRIRTDDRGRSR